MIFFEGLRNRGIVAFAQSERIPRSEAEILARDRAEAQQVAVEQGWKPPVSQVASQLQPVEIPLMERENYFASRSDIRVGRRVSKMAKEKRGYVIGGAVGLARFLGADVMPDDVEQTVDKFMHVAPVVAVGLLGLADGADYWLTNSRRAGSRVHKVVKGTKKVLQYGVVAIGGYNLGELAHNVHDSFTGPHTTPLVQEADPYTSSRYDAQTDAVRRDPEDYEKYPYDLGSNNSLDMTPDRVNRINDYQRELRHAAEQTGQYPHRFDVNIPEIPKIDEDCTNTMGGPYDSEPLMDRLNDVGRIPGVKDELVENLAARSAVCQDLYDAQGEEYWETHPGEKLEVARQAGVLPREQSPVLVPEPRTEHVVTPVDPYDIDHVTAPNGAVVDGNAQEGWTYNGKPWHIVENGEKNIRLLISQQGEHPDAYGIHPDKLVELLKDDVWQWTHGKLPSTDEGHDLFHFSNGTRSIFYRLLNNMSLKTLEDLGVISTC